MECRNIDIIGIELRNTQYTLQQIELVGNGGLVAAPEIRLYAFLPVVVVAASKL